MIYDHDHDHDAVFRAPTPPARPLNTRLTTKVQPADQRVPKG
eukprot:CAMPEP_0170182070 /NCGR_PEP_ID=MMETSP0040_2-20121228/26832_1 /TAXON_ID=641309 /ORGANISM="Lotharella oceanica, Strain CCMP622" /LENGTH=41 /DNA_ID= /DNA_START= /DNA_END= /DNA_ORIENTATION=